jgi:hypothetical protein
VSFGSTLTGAWHVRKEVRNVAERGRGRQEGNWRGHGMREFIGGRDLNLPGQGRRQVNQRD